MSGLIGKAGRRGDLINRARGDTRFTDDLQLPRMLHGKTLRCPHPHARIVSIDTSRALAMPGVLAVITGRDLPERFGIIPWTPDEHALAIEHARFVGDGVAAVAALDERTATRACEAIEVVYEVLPSAVDLDTAMNRPEIGLSQKKDDNVSKAVDLAFGDVDGELAGSDVVLEGDYLFEGTTHVPIEPHCAVAQYDAAGLLTVWSTTQVPHYLHRELSRVLRMSPTRIRVIQPPLGGAFGGKSEPFGLEFCAAKLAMLTGRPVKFLFTREEVFYAHRGRHPMRMHFKLGAKSDGTLTAIDAKNLIDGGAYSSFGLVTTYYSGQLLSVPTAAKSYRFASTRVFTNKPPCGPKRGHGSVQPRFAFEVMLDRMAERLELDPIELRRKNAVPGNTHTINGMRVTSNGFLECLDKVEAASGWKERRGKLGFGRGLGVASSAYISGTNYPIYPNEMPQSAVQLKVDRSGVVTVFNGASDIGQGTDMLMATIVADELGLPLECVRVVSADSDLCPVDLGAYSSRGTFMSGNACLNAARLVKAKLIAAVATKLQVPETSVFVTRGALCVKGREAEAVPVEEAIRLAEVQFGTLARSARTSRPEARRRLSRRHHRRLAGVLVHRARGRGEGRRGDGRGRGGQGLVRARLRQGAVAHAGHRADRGLRVHGRGRGDLRGARHLVERPAPRPEPARLPHPHQPRRAADQLDVRGVDRPRRPARREGGRRGSAALQHPRGRQRHLRRGGRAVDGPALLARARARSAPAEEGVTDASAP